MREDKMSWKSRSKVDNMPMSEDFDLDIDDSKVEILNNRIYFYSDVNEKSVLSMNKHLQSLHTKARVYAAQNGFDNCYGSGQAFVNVQSYGGSLMSGLSAMDTILEIRQHMPITTMVDGYAASAATFITMVGTRRLMRRTSYMLVHQLSSGFWGKYEEMRDEMRNLDMFMESIRDAYGKYTKVPKKEISQILKKDIWWDAKTCLDYGLIDEII
jgi:ATP-dependent protease ClpP protease subunit